MKPITLHTPSAFIKSKSSHCSAEFKGHYSAKRTQLWQKLVQVAVFSEATRFSSAFRPQHPACMQSECPFKGFWHIQTHLLSIKHLNHEHWLSAETQPTTNQWVFRWVYLVSIYSTRKGHLWGNGLSKYCNWESGSIISSRWRPWHVERYQERTYNRPTDKIIR